MSMAEKFCVVLIIAPVGRKAKQIARQLVQRRLAACVNIVPQVHSIYWWQGKMEEGSEALLVVKTRGALLSKLLAYAKSIHPYSVPEIIALPLITGHGPYLDWISAETGKIPSSRRRDCVKMSNKGSSSPNVSIGDPFSIRGITKEKGKHGFPTKAFGNDELSVGAG